MPPVCACDRTIAAVEPPVVRIVPARAADAAVDVLDPWIADAMGPFVVRADCHATGGLALNRQPEAVFIGRTATVHSSDIAVEVPNSRCWIGQPEPSAF